MSRAGLLALVAAGAALALPASASAATVAVEELSTEPRQAKVAFAGAPGEANRLTVSIAGEEDPFYELRLIDDAAPIQPGPGCSGGGAAGAPVLCKVHKPTFGKLITCFKGCHYEAGTTWELNLSFALGDAGSSLDTTALPAGARDPEQWWSEMAPISVTVTPGAGDDTVLTGPGPDLIEASPGVDLIRTGEGRDEFRGGPAPDGPDDVDLGDASQDTIDYSERAEGIRYDPNGLADDGAAGEGDELGPAGSVSGGAGADTLISAGGDALDYGATLYGGAGGDTIFGGPKSDYIYDGEGDDALFGGAGEDWLGDSSRDGEGSLGSDTGAGGAGDDEIRLGDGDDRSLGGAGEDAIESGPGDDRAAGNSGRDRIELGPGADRAAGGPGGDLLLGERGDDEILGEAGDDRLSGDVGSDSLRGGAGADRIAAGMAVARPWGLRAFLRSSGPLEGRPDRVACGSGRDGVKTGPGDRAAGCESIVRAGLFELRGLEQSDGYLPPRIEFTVRRPGIVRLEGKGLKPKELIVEDDHEASNFGLWPVGRYLESLLRDGRVRMRLQISFHAVDGREVIRFRTVDLWLPVGLDRHEPA